MSKNDDKILVLTQKISAMKEDLKNNKKAFVPKTNCILDFHGEKYNLHALSIKSLQELLISLYMVRSAEMDIRDDRFASALEDYEPMYNKYHIIDWMEDITEKISILRYKEKEKELANAEKMLSKLLSEDKKVELQIDEIAKQFGLE